MEKYYRYKYVEFSDGAKAILNNSTMKFSAPNEFNDPFDCFPEYSEKSIRNYVYNNPRVVKKAGDALKLSPAERILKKGVFQKNIEKAALGGKFLKDVNKTIGAG